MAESEGSRARELDSRDHELCGANRSYAGLCGAQACSGAALTLLW